MSVERRERDGQPFFVVRWRAGGAARSKTFNPAKFSGSLKKAERAAHVFDDDVSEQLIKTGLVRINRGAQTVSGIWPAWFDDGVQNWSDETIETYSSMMDKHVLPTFGRRQVGAIVSTDVEAWQASLKRAGVGPSAIQKATTVLSSVLSYARRAEMIEVNPVRGARKAPAPRKRTPTKVPPLKIEMIRKWFLDRGFFGDATLISMLGYAGLRPESEAVVFDWRDFRSKTLLVQPNRKLGAKEREVELLAPLREDVLEWRQRSGRIGGLMLPYGAGGVSAFGREWRPDDYDRWRGKQNGRKAKTPDGEREIVGRWAKAVAFAGLPQGTIPRDLRGSFASLLIWEGRSVVDVARQTGHKPATCLNIYAGDFEAFDPIERRPAVDMIHEAREHVFGGGGGLHLVSSTA